MALVALGFSRCVLCQGLLDEGDDILGFTAGIVWGFSSLNDAAVHRLCFQQWDHRESFIEAHNATFPSRRLSSSGHYSTSDVTDV